jgi:leucyl-tRNA synthetase
MFPYPSGAGLHMGHTENFAATDILGRFKLAQGYNVMHPMGWDAFGLPAEQYAVKTGTHPRETTRTNIENFKGQLRRLGLALDMSREINTTDPLYFKWTQWIFLKLFKAGLAYTDERPVNYCPALGTVLANEEVIDGKSEVGGHPVERRALRQWVLKITAYADKLLEGLEGLNWPESTKTQQRNWIGRSHGAEVRFQVDGLSEDESLVVFTTRPDTLFGATYMVVAPEHPMLERLMTPPQQADVELYAERARSKSDLDRTDLAKEKTGVFTGSYAINPVNGARIPVWVADYVLMTYGTGAIMAVPAHDERDFEFARKFQLPIQRVIEPERGTTNGGIEGLPYVGPGYLVHSGDYTGLSWEEGKQKIIADLEKRGAGKETINYKLRDWLFARQRYWGEPFPIAWVEKRSYEAARAAGGEVARWMPEEPQSYTDEAGEALYALPIPGSSLPVELPETDNFQPTGTGESPLAKVPEWVDIWLNVSTGEIRGKDEPRPRLPKTGDPEGGDEWVSARRETNTMPQWAGSCWYYLRYLDPQNDKQLVSPGKLAYWGMPDLYMGGKEHTVLHLLYARFWHRFLYDEGVVDQPEPFPCLYHQGLIMGEDGNKMSKSIGNVVNPDEYIESHGADSLRAYLMFMGPLQDNKPWNRQGIQGIYRFLRRIWRTFVEEDGSRHPRIGAEGELPKEAERTYHQTVKKVTEDTASLNFNTAISQLMVLSSAVADVPAIPLDISKGILQMLAPYAPHLAEELWEKLGESPSITRSGWPSHDPDKLVEDAMTIVVQVNGKVRAELSVEKNLDKEAIIEQAKNHEKVAGYLAGRTLRREIYVPQKLVNLVVA